MFFKYFGRNHEENDQTQKGQVQGKVYINRKRLFYIKQRNAWPQCHIVLSYEMADDVLDCLVNAYYIFVVNCRKKKQFYL